MKSYVTHYLEDLKKVISDVEPEDIVKIIDTLKKANESKKQIFLIGNGGSASTANHFVCDFGKNAIKGDKGRYKIISLCDNISYITAYGNDVGYDSVFAEQLKNLMEEGDLVLAISASGNSPNIIKAVEYAKQKNGVVIGLTGGCGGKLKELSDININVPSNVIEQVEDAHLIFEHIIVYVFKQVSNAQQAST